MSKVDMAEVWKLKDQGYLKCQSWHDELHVFNYTPRAEFERNWNWYTRNLRGAVLDKNGNFVARAIPKFFNVDSDMEESKYGNLPRHLPCQITNKADGSLIHAWKSPLDGKWQISSKCSFDNDYTKAAMQFFTSNSRYINLPGDISFCFEVRFNEDKMRRVTDMPAGLYLITGFNVEAGVELSSDNLYEISRTLAIPRVETVNMTFDEAYSSYRGLEGTEGYVCRFEDGTRVKLKTPWYFVRNKFLADINSPAQALESIRGYLENWDYQIEEFLDYVPPEYRDEVRGYIAEIIKSDEERGRLLDLEYARCYTPGISRKEFASKVMQIKDVWLRSALFAKLDNKPFDKFIHMR